MVANEEMTFQQLADRLGVHLRTVQKWVRGQNRFGLRLPIVFLGPNRPRVRTVDLERFQEECKRRYEAEPTGGGKRRRSVGAENRKAKRALDGMRK